MNVKNVEKENGAAKITIEIAKDEFQTALDKAYAKIRKDIMIPGFRKGKAPRKFVERMYGSQVFYEDAVNEIFPDIYEAAIVKQELKAVGQPSVTDMQTPEDGSVVLTVSTELYPEITLGEYKGIEVPRNPSPSPRQRSTQSFPACRSATPASKRSTAKPRPATPSFWTLRALWTASRLTAARPRATP